MNENSKTLIPRIRAGNRMAKENKPKLRVAAYCRVSTDSDEQAEVMKCRFSTIQNILRIDRSLLTYNY